MPGIYTPCPTLQNNGGYFILRSVEKRFHSFLRCRAVYLPADEVGQIAPDRLEPVSTSAEFKDAIARLPTSAILCPIESGSPVVLYVARPGKGRRFVTAQAGGCHVPRSARAGSRENRAYGSEVRLRGLSLRRQASLLLPRFQSPGKGAE